MLGSRVMLADDGGGPAAVMVTSASVASAAAAAAAAVGAGRAGARLLRGAAVELRLHGFIELSVSLAVSLAILFVFFCFVLSALAFHFGALPSLKAQAACVLSLSRFTRASILVVELSSHFAFMRNGRAWISFAELCGLVSIPSCIRVSNAVVILSLISFLSFG